MTLSLDSARDCRQIFSNAVQGESAMILLRSKIRAAAQRLGFTEMAMENMTLVASEMVTNQVKHAGGRGLFQLWQQPGPTLDLVALDYGPGIPNLHRAQEDGYSSVNTLGKGLGSIQRLSDEAHIFTQPPGQSSRRWSGTVVMARFRKDRQPEENPRLGLYLRSLLDERFNGDRVYLRLDGDLVRWLHLDGLGHGENAHKATQSLSSHLAMVAPLTDILAAVDRQLRETRGAVGILGEMGIASGETLLLGIGDMHAHSFHRDELQSLSFAPGVLGREHKRPDLFHIPLPRKGRVITASDGIRRTWNQNHFPGLFHHHPQLIAYVLGNIMGRISDDQSLCVVGLD